MVKPEAIRKLARELSEFIKNPVDGIKIIDYPDDLTSLQLWVKGPDGSPYEGGCFKVKLVVGSEFPASPPAGYFLTNIFHPNVSTTGRVCVNTLKNDWKRDFSVKHIFMILKCLLLDPNPESALNEHASRLLLEDYESYAKHARMITKLYAPKSSDIFPNGELQTGEAPANNAPPESSSSLSTSPNECQPKHDLVATPAPLSVKKRRRLMRI